MIVRELDGTLSQLLLMLPLCAGWLERVNWGKTGHVRDRALANFVTWAKTETTYLQESWSGTKDSSREWLFETSSGLRPRQLHKTLLLRLIALLGARMRDVLSKLQPESVRFWRAASASGELGVFFQTAALLLTERYVSRSLGARAVLQNPEQYSWTLILEGRKASQKPATVAEHLAALRDVQKRLDECFNGLQEKAAGPAEDALSRPRCTAPRSISSAASFDLRRFARPATSDGTLPAASFTLFLAPL